MLNAELRVLSGKQAGNTIPLAAGRFLIGREEDCHLRPGNDLVSRHHCVFKMDEYTVRIRDLGSTNGTFVNGERLRGEVMLNTGDQVKVGTLEFEVLITESVTASGADVPAEPVTLEGEPDASQTMVEMPTTSDEDSAQDVAALQETGEFQGDTVYQTPPPATADPYQQQQQPGQAPMPIGYQMPYPQQPYMYGQPYGMPMGYPQQPMPYPPMYPQQPMPMPQQGYPQQPAVEEPADAGSSDESQQVSLPDPSTTGAKPPEPPASDGGKKGSGGGGEVSTTAMDIIKQYTQRRPNTGKK